MFPFGGRYHVSREGTVKLYVFIVNQELRSLTINGQQGCIQVIKISLKDLDNLIELHN
jgi:hypothetical protein